MNQEPHLPAQTHFYYSMALHFIEPKYIYSSKKRHYQLLKYWLTAEINAVGLTRSLWRLCYDATIVDQIQVTMS